MLRYFIAQHPTFGSYKNPIPSKVEASPFYFWWLALTLNEDYSELCERLSNGQITASTDHEQTMLNVYKDFGDVRYSGNRHKAFADWWTAEVGRYKNGAKIRRGEYLFAEPQDSNVHYVKDEEHAKGILSDDSFLLLALPKVNDKSVIEQTLKRIVDKHYSSLQGRDARNPKFSKARYRFSKEVTALKLVKAFNLYYQKQKSMNEGRKIENADLAELADIVMSSRGTKAYIDQNQNLVDDKQSLDAWEKRRSDSNAVGRYLSDARKMISNAAIGIFP